MGDPATVQDHIRQAQARAAAGDLAGARAAVEAAESAGAAPRVAAAYYAALGLSFHQAGDLADADRAYQDALRLDPNLAEPHNNLAALNVAWGRVSAAERHYRAALALDPGLMRALGNLVILLRRQGRLAEAEAACLEAVARAPDVAEAHQHLGRVYEEQGRTDAARTAYLRAQDLDPSFAAAARLALTLPVIPMDVGAARADFIAGLESLERTPGQLKDLDALGQLRWFQLAYHGQDDRPIVERLARLFRARAPQLNVAAAHVAAWAPPAGRRVRVGFLSDFFRDHSIGRFYRGFIERLDRARFEVVVIHGAGSVRDPVRDAIDAAAEACVVLAGPLAAQQKQVAGLRLDVLIHPDIGMSSSTYWLAFGRFAPVQATTLGHPDTSGIDTIDWFLSSALTEPQGADAHYSERLAKLPRLPSFYARPPAPAVATRAEFGLPAEGALYGCPQSLFKIHPDFDAVLADIAARDPSGHIVLPQPVEAHWRAALEARWAVRHPGLAHRVVFAPRVAGADFGRLCATFDVILDPIHFGSGVTLYEAAHSGTPIVTWPGHFARGRYVAGAYDQMQIADAPVARDLAHYAELAVGLAHDAAQRDTLKARILGGLAALYEDLGAVSALEDWLTAVTR